MRHVAGSRHALALHGLAPRRHDAFGDARTCALPVAFFERYLNGRLGPLVDGRTPSPYDDVTVASRNIPGPEQLAENGR
jgi:hypothetical protein